ncbi:MULTISPECIES: hypothetical protein [Kitasatospora]|uniref:PE domain-containing protein n=1 Tax=Kitasatospora cystarginea TaxID=58350 RepID=A0ABN3DCW4_9ACTN
MSGNSFQIDLDVVEGAAQQIQRMLEDLQAPTAKLQAVVKQITEVAYGTDPLGHALTGGTSGVGGLPQHQDEVLAGIQEYLQNSAVMAQNLLTMCQRYRETDDQQAAQLRAIGGPDMPPAPVSAPVAPVAPVAAPVTDPGWRAPTGVVYQDPNAPALGSDQSASTERQPPSRPAGGGGHQAQLI